MAKTLILVACVLSLPGCLLETETCGFDFIEQGDRCVPRAPAPPYRGSPEAGGATGEPVTPEGPDAAGTGGDTPYRGYTYLRLVDRTPLEQALLSDDAPGADIDAVVVAPADNEVPVAVLGEVLEVVVPDTDRLFGEDAPIAMLAGPDGLFFSLGGEGASVMAELNLARDLAVGDVMRVVEIPDVRGFADTVEVSLCRDPEGEVCVLLGQTPPSREGTFVLDGAVP